MRGPRASNHQVTGYCQARRSYPPQVLSKLPESDYTLRCCPCDGHPLLGRFDALLREGLGSILNLTLSNNQWLQASLPVKMGGLGIRRVVSLALSAFLASAASTRALQCTMLGDACPDIDPTVEWMEQRWNIESQTVRPGDEVAHKQSSWDGPLIQKEIDSLIGAQLDPFHHNNNLFSTRQRLAALFADHVLWPQTQ